MTYRKSEIQEEIMVAPTPSSELPPPPLPGLTGQVTSSVLPLFSLAGASASGRADRRYRAEYE